MDELEISGKRYISSKRIARENKYHSDYIGQLIRGGKIVGTKVGRAWYVDEESFAAYLSQENKTYVAPAVTPAAVPSSVVVVPTETADMSSEVSVPVAETNITIEESSAPIHIRKEEVRIETPTAEITIPTRNVEIKKTNLTYVPDSSPLFPEIAKRNKDISRPVAVRVAPEPQAPQAVAYVAEPQSRHSERSALLTIVKGTALVAVGAGVLGLVFFASLGINSSVFIEKGKPASVGYSQEKTFCFISGDCQTAQN